MMDVHIKYTRTPTPINPWMHTGRQNPTLVAGIQIPHSLMSTSHHFMAHDLLSWHVTCSHEIMSLASPDP